MRLFVGNLCEHATEAEVREHFSAVGPLAFIYLPIARETRRPRGIAFVEFTDAAQAGEAIRRFHQQPFQGKPLIVSQARARDRGPGARNPAPTPPSRTSTDGATERSVTDTRPPHRGGAQGHFGPDAAPRGQRKSAKRGPHSTRGPKGPIPQRRSGQFFGGDEDDADGDARSERLVNSSQE